MVYFMLDDAGNHVFEFGFFGLVMPIKIFKSYCFGPFNFAIDAGD